MSSISHYPPPIHLKSPWEIGRGSGSFNSRLNLGQNSTPVVPKKPVSPFNPFNHIFTCNLTPPGKFFVPTGETSHFWDTPRAEITPNLPPVTCLSPAIPETDLKVTILRKSPWESEHGKAPPPFEGFELHNFANLPWTPSHFQESFTEVGTGGPGQ